MLGVLTWVACGLAVGFFVSNLMSASDKGLAALTLSVGVAGSIVGGFVAALLGFGTGASFSFYALICALAGASVALFGYRRLIHV